MTQDITYPQSLANTPPWRWQVDGSSYLLLPEPDSSVGSGFLTCLSRRPSLSLTGRGAVGPWLLAAPLCSSSSPPLPLAPPVPPSGGGESSTSPASLPTPVAWQRGGEGGKKTRNTELEIQWDCVSSHITDDYGTVMFNTHALLSIHCLHPLTPAANSSGLWTLCRYTLRTALGHIVHMHTHTPPGLGIATDFQNRFDSNSQGPDLIFFKPGWNDLNRRTFHCTTVLRYKQHTIHSANYNNYTILLLLLIIIMKIITNTNMSEGMKTQTSGIINYMSSGGF